MTGEFTATSTPLKMYQLPFGNEINKIKEEK